LGEAYRRSYEFFLSDVVTSSGAKKRFYNVFRVEGFLGYPLRVLVAKFGSYTIHSYRFSGRRYYVFSEEFYPLFETVARLVYTLNKLYRRDIEKVFQHIDRAANLCSSVAQCVDTLSRELSRAERIYEERVARGRKALTARLKKGVERCRDVVERFFRDLSNPHIRRYKDSEDLEAFLRKLFSDRVARGYRRFAEARGPIIVARDGIVLLAREGEPLDSFSIYVDGCSASASYAIAKIVGAETLNGYVYRIKWVALLGIDLYTNQLFLHYVPTTLALRRAELCRLWILGLVDDFGKPLYREDLALIEA